LQPKGPRGVVDSGTLQGLKAVTERRGGNP
jgi:hypothetical protein